MKRNRTGKGIVALLVGALVASCVVGLPSARAQTSNVIQDSFTGTTAQLPWVAFNGACLTAGTQTGTGTGVIPQCSTLSYYSGQTQTGLTNNADPAGSGALRLTNGCYKNGTSNTCYYHQNGAIIDTAPYPSNAGISVTFTTYTYGGDNNGGHGADGIGFYLLGTSNSSTGGNNTISSQVDTAGNPLPNIGAWGGSLGYSCSNTNANYDGMAGAYMGLGMDEFGNFLNSPDNTGSGDQATSSNGGNGAQYQPGRIGLRAYGNVNLAALRSVNPNATVSDVQATCQNGGTYNWSSTSTNYTYSYTYAAGGAVSSPYVTQSVTLSVPSGTSNPSSTYQSTCSGTTTTTTSGSQGSTGGSQTNYTGANLYSISSSTSSGTPVTGSTNITVGSGHHQTTYTCATSTVTTTTTYTFATAGAPITTATTSNTGNGFTGSGTAYGQVTDSNGNQVYYPLTITTNTNNVTNNHQNTFPDYQAISGAFVNLPSTTPIAKETVSTRTAATPISYKLQITQDGLLSLWYSWNGGTYNPVLTGQSISSTNGPLPSAFLFGFGGSTGGSDNVHEITCFQVTPADQSASSAGLNVQQSGQVKTGTQVYLASYHVNNWWGELTSQNLVVANGVVTLSSTVNWDASCVLTGGTCTAMNSATIPVQAPSARTLYTLNDSTGKGIQLAYTNLSTTEQGWLNDDGNGANRLLYLTGDRSNEVPSSNATSTQIFRDRNSVLGDIIDSSPTWVGPPTAPYPATWKDNLYPTASPAENAGTQTYPAFATANATRLNVVYDGANDGFMHGFRAGSYDTNGGYVSTNNDGQEVIGYMPEAVLQTIHNKATPALDYSGTKYAHNYFTDATASAGDLFYNNTWHTWLVSGLGPGGDAIFALDITDPTKFTAANASSIVIGEWGANNISCVGDTSTTKCASNLGQSYGTPQIRRLHNGEWGIIFGNGLNNSTGDAGIYVMTFTTAGALDKIYYLDTGTGSTTNANGIAYVTPTDLDGDHITDYVYAGDLLGNVWRFDLTNSDPTKWAASTYGKSKATPLFTTPSTTANVTVNGNTTSVTSYQPITTQVTVVSVSPTATGTPRVMVEFGTGSFTPQTATAAISYTPGQQTLYGIWDWYMGQTGTANASFAGLVGSSSAPTSSLTVSQLQQQTITNQTSASQSGTGQGYRTVSNNNVCFTGSTCTALDSKGNTVTITGTQFGWYLNLTGFNGVSGVAVNNQTEQVIYNPVETSGALLVNTVVPANNSPLTCTVQSAQGWTMALDPGTGGAFSQSFFANSAGNFVNVNGAPVSGIALNATGSPSIVTALNHTYLVSQTTTGAGTVNPVNPPGNSKGGRLTWLEIH